MSGTWQDSEGENGEMRVSEQLGQEGGKGSCLESSVNCSGGGGERKQRSIRHFCFSHSPSGQLLKRSKLLLAAARNSWPSDPFCARWGLWKIQKAGDAMRRGEGGKGWKGETAGLVGRWDRRAI